MIPARKAIAAAGEDALVLPDFVDESEAELQ